MAIPAVQIKPAMPPVRIAPQKLRQIRRKCLLVLYRRGFES